ncbi:hypothetical protein J2S70_000198 [Trueperella bonasi]|uniref:Uncharacterized protein n=1 Tax=Trueperella bonasi TaxID=312286 RepID=A0ABT9NE06_9ACTO|nr:hypothetical protein [Trueperella bonasi]MDP9805616.1 hypothetical protein [Trueperella bonasi]
MGMLVLLVTLPLVYTGHTLISKNSTGTWDEASRLKGRMRSQGWRVKETVDNLAQFQLRSTDLPSFWPITEKAAGVECVTSSRSTPVWRAGSFVAPSIGTHLLFTIDLPQRSDGTEAEFQEALVRIDDDGLTYEGAGDVPAYLNDDVRRFLVGWPGLQAAHFRDDMVTYMFDGKRQDQVERLKTIAEKAPQIIRLIPNAAWK